MNRDILPDSAAVVRYVKHIYVKDGKIQIGAFRLRPIDKGKISVSWLRQSESNTKDEQLDEVRNVIGLKLGEKDCFAELCVGETKRKVNNQVDTHKCKIEFIHAPSKTNRFHSQIIGMPMDNQQYAHAIARLIIESVITTHPAVKDS